MGWKEKSTSFSFEDQPIDGLFFIDGKLLAQKIPHAGTEAYKFPTIVFPSGVQCDLWESSDPDNAVVHIFGEMDLMLNATRDEGYTHAYDIAEQVGYLVQKDGDDAIEAFSGAGERVRIVYDNDNKRMANIFFLRQEEAADVARKVLLDEQSRAALPSLYSNEQLGLEAKALVKFFTPDAHWVWYGSEFDGEDVFFGLVAGDEVELGYFSLTELSDVTGALGLPVERDRFFTPTSLKELRDQHIRERTIQDEPVSAEPVALSLEAEQLIALKDGILERFQKLPPEHQATLVMVLLKTAIDTEQGTWLKEAITLRYLITTLFPRVDRDDLHRIHRTQDEIAQLSDDDLRVIGQRMRDHYVEDMFWDELAFQVDAFLSERRQSSDK